MRTQDNPGPTDAETFLNHFEAMASAEAKFYRVSEPGVSPPLHTFAFNDIPEPKHITALTYGLSRTTHPDWKLGRPELVISVASTDISWALAMGEVALRLRGQCPFRYGNTIRFGTAISPESEMAAFAVFAPAVMDRAQATVTLAKYTVHVAQMYPIYEGEMGTIRAEGPQAFFRREIDFYDIHRPDTSRAG